MIMKSLKWLDENIEKIVIMITYSTMAAIICVEVVRRFVMNQQVPWSTSIPILLFLWVTWFGASYNVKQRTHLRMSEFRERMPYNMQFACQCFDAVLWIVFAGIVIYFTVSQTYLAYDNFSIVEGTDNIMQWWFYTATPIAWSLIIYRVLQNLWEDIVTYKSKLPFHLQASLLE